MNKLLLTITTTFFMLATSYAQQCKNIDQWDSNIIYQDGHQAVYSGQLYEANWYSKNQNPEQNSGQWQVWTNLGTCDDTQEPATVKFIFPLEAPSITDNFAYWNIGSYPDLDPSEGILDYTGGTATYNNHHGTDIGLGANGWTRMDAEIVNIIAAADGILREKRDGEYDRRCGGAVPRGEGNYVKLEHSDGTFTIYAHMKNGTVTNKPIGSSIQAGEYLGKIGSSGNSSGPHLHFDVRDANNELIDPNHVDPAQSRWITPLEYLPSAMPDIIISDEDISYDDSCDDGTHDFQSEFFTRKNTFELGETVRIFRFFNNTKDDQTTLQEMIKPDGSKAWVQTDYINVNWQILIYVSQLNISTTDQVGTWTFRETYAGKVYERSFEVIDPSTSQTTCSIPTWDPEQVYRKDDLTAYNGNVYRADWYRKNHNPEEYSGPHEGWTLLGPCASSARYSNTSVNELLFEVFPNPSSEFINIAIGSTETLKNVSLINPQGVSVLESNESTIDISNLETGVYIISVETNSQVHTERLIVR